MFGYILTIATGRLADNATLTYTQQGTACLKFRLLATLDALHAYPAIILCPPHLVEKWLRNGMSSPANRLWNIKHRTQTFKLLRSVENVLEKTGINEAFF